MHQAARALWWLPVLVGGLYLLVVLAFLPHILNRVWLSSDSDIDAVLAVLSRHAPAGTRLVTGDFAHDETIAFTLLTRSWPGHRTLWMIAPVVGAAVGLGALVLAAARAFGRWPAAVVGAALACLGGAGSATLTAGGLATVLAIDAHANTVISAAVCAAALVVTLPRVTDLSARRLAGVAVAIGVIGGLPLAGDSLSLAWELGPLIVVVVLVAWRSPSVARRRTLAFGLAAVAVTALVALALATVMSHAGVLGDPDSHHGFLTFATPEGLFANLRTFLHALPLLTAGEFYGQALSLRSALEATSAVLLFTALACGLWAVRRRVADAAPRGDGGPVDARFVHVAFWTTALVAGIAVFMAGSPNPVSTDGRYLLGPYVAVAALLPVLIARGPGWRLAVATAVTVFAASALIQFRAGVLSEMGAGFPSTRTAERVAAFARRERVVRAYGEYWTSIDLSWNSDFRIDVSPVQQCQISRQRLCVFREISLTSWDRPGATGRSMLVVDAAAARRGLGTARPLTAANLLRAFGRPLASERLGGLILDVYPTDLARRLLHQDPWQVTT